VPHFDIRIEKVLDVDFEALEAAEDMVTCC
jgi:hypothetical protein